MMSPGETVVESHYVQMEKLASVNYLVGLLRQHVEEGLTLVARIDGQEASLKNLRRAARLMEIVRRNIPHVMGLVCRRGGAGAIQVDVSRLICKHTTDLLNQWQPHLIDAHTKAWEESLSRSALVRKCDRCISHGRMTRVIDVRVTPPQEHALWRYPLDYLGCCLVCGSELSTGRVPF